MLQNTSHSMPSATAFCPPKCESRKMMRCLKKSLSFGSFQDHLSVFVLFLSFGGLDAFTETGTDILDVARECGGLDGNGKRIAAHKAALRDERRNLQCSVHEISKAHGPASRESHRFKSF